MLGTPASGPANLLKLLCCEGVRTLHRGWPEGAKRRCVLAIMRATPVLDARLAMCVMHPRGTHRSEARSVMLRPSDGPAKPDGVMPRRHASKHYAWQLKAAVPGCGTQRDAPQCDTAPTLPLDRLTRAVSGRVGGTNILTQAILALEPKWRTRQTLKAGRYKRQELVCKHVVAALCTFASVMSRASLNVLCLSFPCHNLPKLVP